MNIHYISWDKDQVEAILKEDSTSTIIAVDCHQKLQTFADKIISNFPDQLDDFLDQGPLLEILSQIHDNSLAILESCNELLVEWEWLIEDATIYDRAYFQDQLFVLAKLLSAKILSISFEDKVRFVDPRDIVITDEAYGAANIDVSKSKINAEKLLPQEGVVLTTFGASISTDNNMTVSSEKRYWELVV